MANWPQIFMLFFHSVELFWNLTAQQELQVLPLLRKGEIKWTLLFFCQKNVNGSYVCQC